jgi:DnaJ like chaperone protein
MSWWGKIIGGTFGFVLGGPLGAALGAALGHNFDEERGAGGKRSVHVGSTADVETIQSAFFTATFTVMGHMAKADGLVSREEIAVAESVMQQMRLNPAQKQLATALFAQGKHADFQLDATLQQLRSVSHRSRHLMQMFLEIQIATALADGKLDAEEHKLLERSADAVGISEIEFRRLLERQQASQHSHSGSHHAQRSSASKLSDAYRVLGVAKDTSMEEIKKAYRRLMNQHHPDKLVAKGLPQEMMELATKKTMEIKEAYELIRKARE